MKIDKDALILAQVLGGGGITPTGNQDISTLNEYDVTDKATARVSADERAKIIPEHITAGTTILGVAGSAVVPTGNQDIETLNEYNVSAKATARVSSAERAKIIPENIKSGETILGVQGTYKGIGYTISCDVLNGTYSGSAGTFAAPTTAQVTITPNTNYTYPASISVSGASYSYNSSTGVITLTNAVSDIAITASCRAVYSIATNIINGTAVGVGQIIQGTSVPITISPNEGYDNPSSVTVSNASYSYDSTSGVVTLSNPTGNVTVTAECPAFLVPSINSSTWSQISAISAAGTAANYFAVGDCKAVTLNGTVGTLSLNNVTLYVYILGFDHNSAVEGTGISFGCFETAIESGINVALCDSHNGSGSTDGSKWFNMNHSGNTSSGGWKGCDMRYDILGSVEVKNQQDATSAATSSPVANTLMAALPSALRAVMKPITKYSDNVGGGGDTAANVTTTVDYLPLLAEYEIFGSRSSANSTEQSHQAQYAFYANGNSKVKYNHSNTSSAVLWWERSATTYANYFCVVSNAGNAENRMARFSFGVAPAFLV